MDTPSLIPAEQALSWRAISSNPVDPAVHAHLRTLTKRLCLPMRGHQDGFLRCFVAGKSVLDIGCAEHDESHWNSGNWQHAKLCNWSKEILGLDILPEAVETLRQRGFNVVCADATSAIDLGRRFERIVVGDVLEHVDKPVDLLRFIDRHLAPGGLAVLRTPNPFWWRFAFRVIAEGVPITNAEHVSWITPCNAMELAERSGLCLVQYRPQASRYVALNPLYYILRFSSGREPEFFSAAYLYIFSKRHDGSSK